MKRQLLLLVTGFMALACCKPDERKNLTDNEMQAIYDEIKTPFKYGLILVPENDSKKLDCPGVFRKDSTWYMTYIVFDGRGYETWMASSKNLLDWQGPCKIMSFPADTSAWDSNQRAGYLALQDHDWGGSYELQKFNNKYWMSYLGGKGIGYEKGMLSIGMAYTGHDPSGCREWEYTGQPVLTPEDNDVRWWEDLTLYKSTVIRDSRKLTGHEFVMYYNAYGDSLSTGHNAERIGMAVSDDMLHWKRYLREPVLNHFRGITGDPQITRTGDTWIMFYFGAFWQKDGRDGAFNRFACSRDLVHWTDWSGKNLIEPSEPYDSRYAHKSCVVKWNGIVYHFYCAVNDADQRGIAVATSSDLGKSSLSFFRATSN